MKLTKEQRFSVTNGLRIAAQALDDLASRLEVSTSAGPGAFSDAPPREAESLAMQFRKQSLDSRQLADVLDAAESIQVVMAKPEEGAAHAQF